MNRKLILWSLISALSGFLFGFDTVVISGAEQSVQKLWGLSDAMHGLVMSSALWGTVLGAILGSFPADKFGRKQTLVWIGFLYFLSALGSAIAPDPTILMIARFIGGIGIGISTVAGPLYISEISPPKHRGRLTGLYQFNLVFAILVAFVSNALLSGIGDNAWRWMLGVEAIPALLYTIFCFALPESPRWLILNKRDHAAGKEVLRQINTNMNEAELDHLVKEIADSGQHEVSRHRFFGKQLRKPIMLVFLLSAFNQLSGINAVLYFAPRIFEMAGLAEKSALLQSIGIGVTNVVFTFIGLYLIDKVGRRILLLMGSVGYITSLALCAWSFATQSFTYMPYFIFAFIGSHGIGQGAVIWVYIAEIFPSRHRAHGTSFGVSVHWVFAAVITLIFPVMVGSFATQYIFGFFSVMMVFQLLWVLFIVPETKGRSLEEMEQILAIK
jgi:sugar porter (SP) family MFS transporter